MLRAIRKFVFGRDRDERREPELTVDEPRSNDRAGQSDVPLQSPQPQLEEASGPAQTEEGHGSSNPASDPPVAPGGTASPEPAKMAASGKVKWFNPAKRFGFVELSSGADAFLHATVLARLGISSVQPGDTLELRVAPGERGPVVTEIIGVDSSTAAAFNHIRSSFQSPADRAVGEPGVEETGTVKWYNAIKGFGFILREGGGKDVFVHASALQRAGITNLNEGQRVVVSIVEGRKGPEAGSIRLT
jgi:cold shock protein